MEYTAKGYDDLGYTAREFDLLETGNEEALTAYWYDYHGKVLLAG